MAQRMMSLLVCAPSTDGLVQGPHAVGVLVIDRDGALREQLLHHGKRAAAGAEVQRRHALLVRQVRVGKVGHEQVDEVHVLLDHGPVQRREAVVAVAEVHRRVERQQQLDDLGAPLGRRPVDSRVSAVRG